MKKWLHVLLSFLIAFHAVLLPPSREALAAEREYPVNVTLSESNDNVKKTWTWTGISPPSYIKGVTVEFTGRQFSDGTTPDRAYIRYQTPSGTWGYISIPNGFNGTMDLRQSLNAVNVGVELETRPRPMYVDCPAKQSCQSDWYNTGKTIKKIFVDGGGTNGTRFKIHVRSSSGAEESKSAIPQDDYNYAEFDTSKKYQSVSVSCTPNPHYNAGCRLFVTTIIFADGTRMSYDLLTGTATVKVTKIIVADPLYKPGQPTIDSSSLSLTNWSTTKQNMTTAEYNAGQKIEQVAIQLSGFYGTYDLRGWDSTLGSWVSLDPSGLTDYNSSQPASVHTTLKWLDLRGRNVTKLMLTANHGSYYGIPSQVSVPIIRTKYDGPNIYLTSVSANNVLLRWSDGGNSQGVTYEVWRETLNSAGQVIKDERIGTTAALSFATNDQEPGKRYRYRVRAVSGSETSAFSYSGEYYTPPAVSVTPGERLLRLNWTPVTGSDTYAIYLEEDGVWYNTGIITNSSGQAVIPDLSPTKRYRVRLEQHKPNHSGIPWATWANGGDYVVPLWDPPGALTISDLKPNSVTISWDGSKYPSGTFFRLYRNGVKLYEGPLTTYTDTTVTAGEEYRYKVTVLNANYVEGPFSPEAAVIPPTLVAPTLRLTSGQTASPWNVILAWEPNGNPSGTAYEVWRETLDSSGNVVADERIGTTTATTFETTDQSSGKHYRYRIRITQGSSYLDSNVVSYWTPPVPSVTAQEGALRLDWVPPAPGAAFNVYLSDGSGWNLVQTTSDSTITIESLLPSKRYQVALEPANLPGGGYPWRAVTEKAPLWHAPGTPSFSNVNATTLTVSWDPNGIAPGTIYQLFRDGTPIWQGSATSFTDSGLSPNTTYRYKVAALNADSVPGTFSPEAAVTTLASQEPLPGDDVLDVLDANYASFKVGSTVYPRIPHVRFQTVTLQWNLARQPEWARYGISLDSLGPQVPFTKYYQFTMPPGDGLKTILTELSTGERYYLTLVLDSQAPLVSLSWLGNATVTKPGGEATLIIRAQDNIYPASDLEVSIDNGPWKPYQYVNELRLSGQGVRDVMVQVRDPAGNIAIQGIQIFVLP